MKKTSVFVLVFLSIALAGIFFFRHLFVPDQKTLGTVIENQVDDNIRNLSSKVISGGMIPKVKTALDAIENNVRAVVILDGRVQNACLLELFTEHGVGTLIRNP